MPNLSDHDLRQMDPTRQQRQAEDTARGVLARALDDLWQARDRLNQGPGNSSRPSGSMEPWRAAGLARPEVSSSQAAPIGTAPPEAPGGQPLDAQAPCSVWAGWDCIELAGLPQAQGLRLQVARHLLMEQRSTCGHLSRAKSHCAPVDRAWQGDIGQHRLLGPRLAAIVVFLCLLHAAVAPAGARADAGALRPRAVGRADRPDGAAGRAGHRTAGRGPRRRPARPGACGRLGCRNRGRAPTLRAPP